MFFLHRIWFFTALCYIKRLAQYRAPVAHLDRATASGAVGGGFEPRRVHHFFCPDSREKNINRRFTAFRGFPPVFTDVSRKNGKKRLSYDKTLPRARLAKLANALGLGPSTERFVGSSPAPRTIFSTVAWFVQTLAGIGTRMQSRDDIKLDCKQIL